MLPTLENLPANPFVHLLLLISTSNCLYPPLIFYAYLSLLISTLNLLYPPLLSYIHVPLSPFSLPTSRLQNCYLSYPLALTSTLLCFFAQVFERVRAGEERLQSVAQGSLSLLRQLIRELSLIRNAAGKGSSDPDAPATRALLEGLRGACPLLLATDSHALLQVIGGCGLFRG